MFSLDSKKGAVTHFSFGTIFKDKKGAVTRKNFRSVPFLFKNNKKGMTMAAVSGLIVIIIFFLVAVVYISDIMGNSKISSQDLQCAKFMESVRGEPAYFGNGLDDVESGFVKAVAKMCVSRDVEVSSSGVDSAVDVVASCFKRYGSGVDFLGSNVDGENLCIYCGKITANDDIDDFRDLFSSKVKSDEYKYLLDSDYEMINYNEAFVSAVPQSILEGDSVGVFYWVYRGKVKGVANGANLFLSKFFGSSSGLTSVANYYLSDSSVVDTYFGVILTDEIDYTSDDINAVVKSGSELENCLVIVPEKHFD